MPQSLIGIQPAAAVGEGIRCDVEYSHHQGTVQCQDLAGKIQ